MRVYANGFPNSPDFRLRLRKPDAIGLPETTENLRRSRDGIARLRLFPVSKCHSKTAGQIDESLADVSRSIASHPCIDSDHHEAERLATALAHLGHGSDGGQIEQAGPHRDQNTVGDRDGTLDHVEVGRRRIDDCPIEPLGSQNLYVQRKFSMSISKGFLGSPRRTHQAVVLA